MEAMETGGKDGVMGVLERGVDPKEDGGGFQLPGCSSPGRAPRLPHQAQGRGLEPVQPR